MNRLVTFIWMGLLTLLMVGCRPEYEAPIPYKFRYQPGSGRFPASVRQQMEGVYTVSGLPGDFGQQVALKWSYLHDGADTLHTLSIFTGVDAGFFRLEIDPLAPKPIMRGYWRKLINQSTGEATFELQRKRSGQLQPYAGSALPSDTLVLVGSYGSARQDSSQPITLTYQRPLNSRPFEILAHRAGGRMSDLLGVSENTVESIRQAASLGATGVEIDVRYTKDSIPVLYHDNVLNQRLIRKNGLSGRINSYTYEQLQTSFDLINGEKIPTLDEALKTVVENTNLDFVYLDSKYTGSMSRVQALQQQYQARARQLGRNVRIVICIPNTKTADAYLALPDRANTPILSELDPATTRSLNAAIWSPRWTLGPQYEETRAMQAEGREVFMWTLDDLDFLAAFSSPSYLNGILSNYSCLVAYYHYTAQWTGDIAS